jgi:PAS domain S-box-containing protein
MDLDLYPCFKPRREKGSQSVRTVGLRPHTIVRTNRVAADSLGLKPVDMAGKPSHLFYPEHAEQYYRDDQEVIRFGKPKLGIVEPLRVSENKIRWIETSKIPIRDTEGGVTGILVLSSDITGRKHARKR